MATSALEWRAKRVETVTLPSGLQADLRKPSVLSLVSEDGDVPDALTAQILEGLNGRPRKKSQAALIIGKENLAQYLGFVNRLVRATFVSPRISANGSADYEGGEISLDDVEDGDKVFVAAWALPAEDAQKASQFLDQQSAGLATVPAGDELRPESG